MRSAFNEFDGLQDGRWNRSDLCLRMIKFHNSSTCATMATAANGINTFPIYFASNSSEEASKRTYRTDQVERYRFDADEQQKRTKKKKRRETFPNVESWLIKYIR